MVLPDLCLLPHEAGDLAPGEPLCAPATHRLASKSLPGLIYLVRSLWVGAGADQSAIWVARREFESSAPLLRVEKSYRASELRQLYADLSRGDFERRLFFESDFGLCAGRQWHLCLALTRYGDSAWIFPGRDSLAEQGRFRWPHLVKGENLSPQWRAHKNDGQIEREVTAMLGDADSDASFALRWLQMSAREREQTVFSTATETLGASERVLQWVLQVEGIWEQETVWTWFIDLNPWLGSLDYVGAVARESELQGDFEAAPLSARQSRLLELVVEYFDPQINEALREKTVVQQTLTANGYNWKVPVSAPTAHERLEAHLQLRAWLRGKVSPVELAELMGES